MMVTCVLVLALGLANAATYLATAAYLTEQLDTTLRDTPIIFLEDSGGFADQDVPRADHDSDPSTGPRAMPFMLLASANGSVLRTQAGNDEAGRSFTADLPHDLPAVAGSVAPGGPAVYRDVASREPTGPELRVKISTDVQRRILVVALPRTETDALLSRLGSVQAGVAGATLLLAGGAAFWLVRHRLASLRRLAREVENLRPGDLAARVHVDTTTREVQDLAIAANVLLQRISDAFAVEQTTQERLRRFVADASHELRTPIAAVSAYAQLFELGAKDNPADLARSMSGIRRETARMHDLAEELLILATAEETTTATRPVDVTAVIGQAVQAALAVDPAWPVTVQVDPAAGRVAAEPAQLRGVLDNLLLNVRTHTRRGTSTRIEARRSGPNVVVVVADNGPGLTEDERSHMFDRFWRKDRSRSREAGGSGLGLSIVATLVTGWGGTVTGAETQGGGLTVTLTLLCPFGETDMVGPTPTGQRPDRRDDRGRGEDDGEPLG
jgi:two-component system OmpR family sensor kinase